VRKKKIFILFSMKNCEVNEQRKNDSSPMVKFNMNAAVFSLFLQPLHKFLKKLFVLLVKLTINLCHYIYFK